MRMVSIAIVLVGLVAVGCGSKGAPREGEPARPAAPEVVPMPDEVLAWVTLPSIAHGLDGLAAFVESQTYLGNLDRASLPAALGELVDTPLAGLDVERPAWLLLTGTKGPRSTRYVLVAHVADPIALVAAAGADHVVVADGRAVIGAPELVQVVARWAHDLARRRPVADRPALVLVPEHVLAASGADILAGIREGAGDMADQLPLAASIGESFSAANLRLLEQSEEIEVRLDASAGELALELSVVARPTSGLATWFAVQSPATLDLLAHLPHDPGRRLIGGRLAAGAHRAGIRDTVLLIQGVSAANVDPAWLAEVDALLDATTGEFALTLRNGFRNAALVGLADPSAALAALSRLVPDDGQPRSWAVTSDTLAVALDADERTLVGLMGSAGSATSQLAANLQARIADARGRRASVLLLWDLASTTSPAGADLAVAIDLAFTDRTARVRLALPSAAALPVLNLLMERVAASRR